MKVFKLANAELKKIFLRPIMFVVFLALIVSVAFLTMSFNPENRTVTAVTVSRNGTIQTAYNTFLDEDKENSKKKIDDVLVKEYTQISNFFTNFNTDEETGQIGLIKARIIVINSSISNIGSYILLYDKNPSQSNRTAVINAFNKLNDDITALRTYLQSIEGSLNFLIKEKDLAKIKTFFSNMQLQIPSSFPNMANEVQVFYANFDLLNTKFNFEPIMEIVNNLKYFDIQEEDFDEILQKYYFDILDTSNVNNTNPKLNALFAEIRDFRLAHSESNEELHFEEFEHMLSQYKSISNMASIVLKNEFALFRAGEKKDVEMREYFGFSSFSSYTLKQNSSLNKHLLDNDLFDYEYLTPFSYNVKSGQTTNAFDFVIYSMQVISFIVAIFSVFIASGTVANEQNSGTMKMLAIRPYSRTKIITAKLVSVINFMIITLLISFAATFAVGYLSYGIAETQSLLIFNAETVFPLNSFLVLGIYFVSLILNMTFYITIALLISVLARSSTVAIIFSILIYGLGLFGNMFFASATWFIYLPLAHLDIFRFFGSQANTGNLFSFTFPLNSNVYISLIYLGSVLLISYLSTVSIFKKRNIA